MKRGADAYEHLRDEFMEELRAATSKPHVFHDQLLGPPGHTLGEWLFVYAVSEHKMDNITRMHSVVGYPTDAAGQQPSARAFVAWCDERLQIDRRGVLARVAATHDDQLVHGVHQLVYQHLCEAVKWQFAGFGRVDANDVAHEFLTQEGNNLTKWCADYDPSKASLKTYLSRRTRPNGLKAEGRRILGLSRRRVENEHDAVATDTFEDAAIDRVDAERTVPPRSTWPPEVRLCFVEGLTYAEAAAEMGIKPATLKKRVLRWRKQHFLDPTGDAPHGPDG